MTVKHIDIIGRVSRLSRVLSTSSVSCATLFLVASAALYFVASAALLFVVSAAPVFAQGDGSATMREIKPFIGFEDAIQWGDMPEVLAGVSKDVKSDPKEKDVSEEDYAWATDLFFEKEIWQLQFKYKNVRSILVNFPTKDGKLETKRVWYLVYSVTNTGERLRAELDSDVVSDVSQTVVKPGATSADAKTTEVFQFPLNNLSGVYKPVKVDYNGQPADAEGNAPGAIRFVPRFVLASAAVHDTLTYERDVKTGLFTGGIRGVDSRVYYDEFIPLANVQIAKKEAREGQTFFDSVRISTMKILPGQTVWGVATWVDVDPKIDRFSVYVSGLTNALRWEISEDAALDKDALVGSGRDVYRKVLRLNFFNPSDESHSGGKEIYNNLPGELDYQWIYM